MSDCGGDNAGAADDCSCAPETSTYCSSSFEPPPDYSACGSYKETGNSNHYSGTTDATQHSHHWHSNYHSGTTDTTQHLLHSSTHCHPISEDTVAAPVTGLYDIAPIPPFHYVSPESENRHDEYVPVFKQYRSRPSYNLSYTVDRPTTRRPNQYEKKTIVLRRADVQSSAPPVTGLYGVAPIPPFNHVSPKSENRHDEYLPRSKRYSSLRSYRPSYMVDRPTTRRPNQYDKKTILLRTTDDQISARQININTRLCIGLVLVISSIVSAFIVIFIFGTPLDYSISKAMVNNCAYKPCGLQYNDRIFNTSRRTTVDPYLTDIYKDGYGHQRHIK